MALSNAERQRRYRARPRRRPSGAIPPAARPPVVAATLAGCGAHPGTSTRTGSTTCASRFKTRRSPPSWKRAIWTSPSWRASSCRSVTGATDEATAFAASLPPIDHPPPAARSPAAGTPPARCTLVVARRCYRYAAACSVGGGTTGNARLMAPRTNLRNRPDVAGGADPVTPNSTTRLLELPLRRRCSRCRRCPWLSTGRLPPRR